MWTSDESSEKTISDDGDKFICDFFQRLPIHVRQKDNIVQIELYRKTPISSESLGACDLDVLLDLIGAEFPRNKSIQLLNTNGQNTCKILLSFFKGIELK